MEDGSEKYAHKQCKGLFLKKNHLEKQIQLSSSETQAGTGQSNFQSTVSEHDDSDNRRQSGRQQHKYNSSCG